MIYREIGHTGKRAGVIGLGCEHLDGKPYGQVKRAVDAAIGHGINLFDIFMPGAEIREHLAKALGTRRKDVMIQGHICSTDIGQQYDISRDLPVVKRYFEAHLRLCGGYIDFGMLFFIDSEEDYKNVFETGIADYALRLKEKGDIGHIGFSSHNPVTAMKAVNTGLPELMMFSINPAFDIIPTGESIFTHLENGFDADSFVGVEPKRAELYRLCEQKKVGITAMKTLGAGKLISPEHTPFGKPLTVAQCVHYALSRPAVASVLPGCATAEEIDDTVKYLTLGDAERDYTEILSSIRGGLRGACLYCSHCQPCPAGIDIAAVNKALDIARLDTANVPPSVRAHYRALGQTGADCVACGHCETRCPFAVPVMENMKEAERLLGH
ncbi:MAG: aldo/keto reductase [Oscillospiraceae bacterium]|nr:aldo/keto reductase [Oscillospiraceae bacterium]